MKVVINACYGGFSLSKEGCQRYFDIKGQQVWIEDDTKFKSMGLFTVWMIPPEQRLESKEGEEFYKMSTPDRIAYNKQYAEQTWCARDIDRHDTILVQVVEEDSAMASGRCAELKVVEVPDDVEYQIEEYDGLEHVAEKHRTWY
jgi:hypothetical protein